MPKTEPFLPKKGAINRCPLSPFLFSVVQEILESKMRQEKEI